MSKQLNIDLIFNANTSQAKAQMTQLQSLITRLQTTTNLNIVTQGANNELLKTQQVVSSLKANLNSAFNVDTGKLDLVKFNNNLKASGMKLSDYRRQLTTLGVEGQKAFTQLTSSIVQGQIPLQKANGLLNSMMTTFGNTLKWQIASSAIQGISSTFSEAFEYAKDLNESLTSIRIVTGKSADEMARFAETANKAAKALATSTTEYTDAALIYYQQGLEGKAVEERAETTLKLANVTGQSAEEISQQLTAVWNNFYDGSKSIEYYADVMTALGAATASSSDEIAEGLEKFAAVADTVGLSYEYATTALATVTAQTRQSADVVGTAFKTIFARIQDLDLGKTLDDGTTMGQYSEALYKVGIDIKDASGNLKDMDLVLQEMGSKWQQINKDQQVALAKSVAGIRQYTQLIALMDNWDTFEANLGVAEGAEGSLQKQQDIWAESWEAAQERVKASSEGLFQTLINDEFFIDLNNSLADLIKGIDKVVEAMGGLKSILPFIAGFVMQAFGPTAITALQNFGASLKGPSKQMQKMASDMRLQALNEQRNMARESGSFYAATASGIAGEELDQAIALESITRKLSNEEEKMLQFRIQDVANLKEQVLLLAEMADKEQERQDAMQANLDKTKGEEIEARTALSQKAGVKSDKLNEIGMSVQNKAKVSAGALGRFLEAEVRDEETGTFQASQANAALETLQKVDNKNGLSMFSNVIKELAPKGIETEEQFKKLQAALEGVDIEGKTAARALSTLKKNLTPKQIEQAGNELSNYAKILGKGAKASKDFAQSQSRQNKASMAANKEAEKLKEMQAALTDETIKAGKIPMSQRLTQTAGALGMVAGGISTVVSGLSTMNEMFKTGEHTLSGWLSVISAIGMGLPMAINAVKSLGAAIGVTTAFTAYQTAMDKEMNKEKAKAIFLTQLGVIAYDSEGKAILGTNAIKLAEAALIAKEHGLKGKSIMLALSAKAAYILEAVGLGALIPAKIADATASNLAAAGELAMLWPIGLLIAALALLAVGIVAVIAVVKAITDAYNADAIAAENARKEAEALAETYNKVKQAYEDLKKSIEDYQNAQNAIDQLKQGTEEWRDAVQAANEQVIALLDKYPELTKYVQTLDGGRMIIADEGLAALREREAEDVAIAANMSQSANLKAKQLQNKADQTDLARNTLTNEGGAWGHAFTAAGGAALLGGIIAAAIPVIGWGVGAAIAGGGALAAGLTEGLTENSKEKQADEYLDNLIERYNKIGEKAFVNLEDELKNLGVNSDEAAESVKKLVREQQQLKEQENILAKSQAANLLNAQSDFNSSGFTDNMNQIAADLMKDYENRYNSLHDTAWLRGNIATDIGKSAFYDYMEKMGYDKSQLRKVDFKSKEIKFQTQDEAGGEWSDTKTLSYEALREAALQSYLAEHAEEMAQKMNALMDTTRQLSKSTNAYDQAMASFLNEGDLSLLDPETYNKLASYSSDELARIYEENKQVFKDAGFESSSELIDGFNEALNTYDPVEAAQNILERRWEDFNNTIKSGAQALEISEDALRAYADTLIDENAALQENEDQAAKTAVAHYRLATNIKDLRDIMSENTEVLKDNTANSLEQADALGAIKEAADKTFGMDISGDFLLEHLELLEKAVNGDIEAFKEFNKLLAQDFVESLVIEDQALKDSLSNELSSIMNEVDDIEIGANLTLDNTKALEALNIALENGSATVEEIEAMFANAGLQFDPGLVRTYKKPSKTVTSTKMTGVWNGTPIDATMTNTVASEVELPWIGDNPPRFDTDEATGEITQIEGTGIMESLDLTKTDTATAYPDVLTYGADDEKEKKKKNKELEAELDRYHEINEILNDIQAKDEALAKIEERSFGAKKIAAMQARIKALDAQAQAYDRVIEEAKKYRDMDKANVEELGGIIDEKSGNIINFEEKQIEYITKLQNIANKDSDEYKKLHEEFETFNDYASKFEESQNKYEKTLDEQIELTKQVLDKELEVIEHKIEIKLEINSREIEKIERQLSRLDDTFYDSANRMTLLQGKINEEFENIDNNKNSIRDVLEKAGVSKEDIESYMAGDSTGLVEKYDLDENVKSALTTYTDSIIESEQNIYDLSKEIPQVFSDTVTMLNEEIDSINENLETQLGIIENYQNIVDLIGKEQAGLTDEDIKNMEKLQNQAASTQVKNAKANMDLTRNTLETVHQKMAEIEDKDSEAYKYWQEQEKALNKQLQEDTENFTSLWASAIQTAYDTFSTETQRAIDNFSDAIAGANFDSMEELQKAYEREVELSDRYIENYQQAYELSKLNRQINQDLDKTDNVKSQKMLRDLQKEIEDIQKSGKQLSEYELNALQKKYDLRLAEIALEDAQNAKSTVRLRRDSEGNFGYVYTANEAEINKAQQNYEDKLYALQELNDNYLEQLSEQVISNRSEMLDELRELEKLYGKDSKKYKEEAAKVIEKYTDNEKYLLGQMQQVYSNNAEVRRLDLENYGTYQLQHISKSTDWVTSFNNTTLGMVTGYDNVEKFQSDLNDKIGSPDKPGTLLGDFYIAYNTLEQRLEDVLENAGIDVKQYRDDTGLYLGEQGATKIFTDFKNYITTAMNGQGGVSENIGKAADAAEDLRDRGDKALNDKSEGLATKVQEFYDKYHPKIEGATEDAEALDTALTNLIGQYDIDVNVDGQEEIEKLTEALRLLTKQIEASKEVLDKGNATSGGGSNTGGSNNNNQRISFTNTKGTDNNDYTTYDNAGNKKALYHYNTNDQLWYKVGNYVNGELQKVKGFERNGNTVSWNANTKGYTLDEIPNVSPSLKIGNQTFAYYNGKWYLRGSTDSSTWNDYINRKSKTLDTSNAIQVGKNQLHNLYYLSENVYTKGVTRQMKNRATYFWSSDLTQGSYDKLQSFNHNIFKKYPDIKIDSMAMIKESNNQSVPYVYGTIVQGDGVAGGIDENDKIYVKADDLFKEDPSEISSSNYDPTGKLNSIYKAYGFDTGGYTGSWGPEGRLAMLHQKEIVLNAHDTENLLTAVSMIREISDKLESNALAMRYLSAIGNYNAAINTNNHDTLQQEVTIHAEFPNATNHSEIEEAFDNLVNLASQYANRK